MCTAVAEQHGWRPRRPRAKASLENVAKALDSDDLGFVQDVYTDCCWGERPIESRIRKQLLQRVCLLAGARLRSLFAQGDVHGVSRIVAEAAQNEVVRAACARLPEWKKAIAMCPDPKDPAEAAAAAPLPQLLNVMYHGIAGDADSGKVAAAVAKGDAGTSESPTRRLSSEQAARALRGLSRNSLLREAHLSRQALKAAGTRAERAERELAVERARIKGSEEELAAIAKIGSMKGADRHVLSVAGEVQEQCRNLFISKEKAWRKALRAESDFANAQAQNEALHHSLEEITAQLRHSETRTELSMQRTKQSLARLEKNLENVLESRAELQRELVVAVSTQKDAQEALTEQALRHIAQLDDLRSAQEAATAHSHLRQRVLQADSVSAAAAGTSHTQESLRIAEALRLRLQRTESDAAAVAAARERERSQLLGDLRALRVELSQAQAESAMLSQATPLPLDQRSMLDRLCAAEAQASVRQHELEDARAELKVQEMQHREAAVDSAGQRILSGQLQQAQRLAFALQRQLDEVRGQLSAHQAASLLGEERDPLRELARADRAVVGAQDEASLRRARFVEAAPVPPIVEWHRAELRRAAELGGPLAIQAPDLAPAEASQSPRRRALESEVAQAEAQSRLHKQELDDAMAALRSQEARHLEARAQADSTLAVLASQLRQVQAGASPAAKRPTASADDCGRGAWPSLTDEEAPLSPSAALSTGGRSMTPQSARGRLPLAETGAS